MGADLVRRLEDALLAVDRLAARRVLSEAAGTMSTHVFEDVVGPALAHIGAGWETGEVALSQVYMSGRICEELAEEWLPQPVATGRAQPPVAIAVLEDYHVLGKRIVCAILRASGFELRDFGRVTAAGLVERTLGEQIEVLLVSTLMLPSALKVGQVVAGLRAAGARTKVVVGGAPFRIDPQLSLEVGADAAGRTATDALPILDRLLRAAP
jgi:methanogenic corrinoid protein MtbC1